MNHMDLTIGKPDEVAPSERLARHLKKVLLLPEESVLRQDFARRVGDAGLGVEHFRIMRTHASPTAFASSNGEVSNLWHIFTDHLRKRLNLLQLQPHRELEQLEDIIVYTSWNTQNFSLILGTDLDGPYPAYPARPDEVTDFPTMLRYLEHAVVPEIKNLIVEEKNIHPSNLEERLNLKNISYEHERAAGIEIMMPISPCAWNKASRPEPQI